MERLTNWQYKHMTFIVAGGGSQSRNKNKSRGKLSIASGDSCGYPLRMLLGASFLISLQHFLMKCLQDKAKKEQNSMKPDDWNVQRKGDWLEIEGPVGKNQCVLWCHIQMPTTKYKVGAMIVGTSKVISAYFEFPTC